MQDGGSVGPSRETAPPGLTVVVIVLGGWNYLVRCLSALHQQSGVPTPEIIVPYDERLGETPALHAQFSHVHFLHVEGRRTYAELRAVGVQKARGAIIALTEDHCTPEADWCAQIVDAHAGRHAAVGGAVEKQVPDTALNWAIYLADYGRYMNPVQEGPGRHLTDCNVSYKRAALDACADVWADEFHEPTVHGALQARGASLWLSPRIVVRQQRSLRSRDAVWDRYAFGRLFASTRVSATPLRTRLLYAACSFMLPPLLIGRIAVNTVRKGRYVREFVRAVPALMLVTSAWTWGEFVGYLTGKPEITLMPRARRAATRTQTGREATT